MFGPPTPKKMRTVSPTFALSGFSSVSAPTAPLKVSIRAFGQQLVHAHAWKPCWPNVACVDLALHHVELPVHLRQPALRLDQDQAVHAVGDVLGHHRRGAVVDVQAGVERLEGERGLLPRRHLVTVAPPPGPVTA